MTKLTDVNTHVARTGGNRTALTVERGPFSQVPHWVWTLDLEHAAIRVYGILMMHADYGTREGFPGIRRIAEEGHMSTNTVQRSLEALERVGAIIVTRTREEGTNERAVNHYHLPWLQHGPPVATIATEEGGGVATIATPGVATIATELETSSYLDKTPTPQTDFAAFGDLAAVVVVDPKTIPEREKHDPDALGAAIAEARKDPTVRNPEAVGRFRYNQQREQQREQARTESARVVDVKRIGNCRRCFGSGSVWFLADGTATTPDNPEGEYTERCDHRPRLAVASP